MIGKGGYKEAMIKRMKFILSAAKRYILKLLLMLGIILVTTYIVATFPFLSGKLVDILFYDKDIGTFFQVAMTYLGLFLVNELLHVILQIINTDLRTRFIYDIKRDMYKKVLSYRSEFLVNMNTGDMIQRINQDTNEVMNFFYSDIFYGISAVFDLVVCMYMLAITNVSLAIVTFFLAVITFVIGKYFSNKVGAIQKEIAKAFARNTTWLYEILNCMSEIKLLGIANTCRNRYLKGEIEFIRLDKKRKQYEVVADKSNKGIQAACTISLYVISAILISVGELTIGGIVVCVDYFNRIILFLERISRRFTTLPGRMVSIDRLIDIWDVPSEDYHEEIPWTPIQSGKINIQNLVFSYDDEIILKNISAQIQPGEKVAIVGKSGEGKSTILNLLCRLYDPQEGKILIDNVELQKYNLHALREQIGIAHQKTVLFNTSLRYNLIFSDARERDDEIWNVLKQVNLYEDICSLPHGLDTMIEVEGNNFSGGQKQRIAMARLFLKNPAVIILDEATSALDSETEANIIKNWSEVFRSKTMLIVAHRFSTVLSADRVLFLDHGEVAGFNTHEKLLISCKAYRSLYDSRAYGN